MISSTIFYPVIRHRGTNGSGQTGKYINGSTISTLLQGTYDVVSDPNAESLSDMED
jgi:hypothetical protein